MKTRTENSCQIADRLLSGLSSKAIVEELERELIRAHQIINVGACRDGKAKSEILVIPCSWTKMARKGTMKTGLMISSY
jgi:hypothetical protein